MGKEYKFSKSEIEMHIKTKWAGKALVFLEETSSTNIVAGELGKAGAAHGTLVVSNAQTDGKGRRGRCWSSPAGKDIYMTLLLRPSCKIENTSALTLVMALSVLEAVEEIAPAQAMIKWPNDIVTNGKKLCGILTEMNIEADKSFFIVVGVGINCNQTIFAEDISKQATSLFLETQVSIDRAVLIGRVLHYFEKNYLTFEKTQDLSGLQQTYNSFLVNTDREVKVLEPKGEYRAIAKGINKSGELIVKRSDNGEEMAVYAGEVSVRGIYGYI